MDWFTRLTGFHEEGYDDTREKLGVSDGRLISRVNGQSYAIGELELVSLQSLRERVAAAGDATGRLRVSIVTGNVRELHQHAQFNRALFQVASQFNLLEMIGPDVTPEDGVTRYQRDPTQGPACAIAAAAATIYRNYFAPVGSETGQTSTRQLDGLADIGIALSTALGRPREDLWAMRNGYALCTQSGLEAISTHLASLTPDTLNELRGLLRIGVHSNVEVTDVEVADVEGTDAEIIHPGLPDRPVVSQAFCSALPVAYSRVRTALWQPFASLVLEAAYEATLLAGVCNARRGGSNIVLLTRLGGGAFGNDDDWIDSAMRRAFHLAAGHDLDVRLVSYGTPSRALRLMTTAE